MNYRIKNKVGFTLVELSVVLIIIGLIIGGVMVGRDLIETSKIRAQVTQISDIETQINTFRVKYNCLPGDCINATSAIGATYNGNTINDGDGDGLIRSIYAYGAVQTAGDCIRPDITGEVSQLLLQLTAAGIGNYKANGALNGANATIGTQYGYTSYGNGTGFFVSCLKSIVSPTYIPTFLTTGNVIIIGAGSASVGRIAYALGTYGVKLSSGYGYYGAGLKLNPIGIPADVARQIDNKIDDGKPSNGIFGIISGETSCADNVASYPTPDVFCLATAGKRIR
jgi:prepilin-type N-terminal cleavage/methylation domain-containing protein